MLRGLLAGGVWGAVISVVILALTSQIADWRDLTPAITEDVASAEPGVISPNAPSDAPGTTPAADAPVAAAPDPSVSPADANAVASPALETSPPQTPASPGAIGQPAGPTTETDIATAPAPETSVAVAPETSVAAAPDLPRAVPQPEPLIRRPVETGSTPAAPPVPAVTDAPSAPRETQTPQLAQRSVQRPDAADTEVAALAEPDAPAPAPSLTGVADVPAPSPADDDAPVATRVVEAPAPAAPAPAQPLRPQIDSAAAPAAPAPQPARVVERERAQVTTIRVNRLPTIGGPIGGGEAPATDAPTEAPADPGPTPTELAALAPDPAQPQDTAPQLPGESATGLPGQSVAGLPGEGAPAPGEGTDPARQGFELDVLSDLALQRNAIPFDPPDGQPLVSIIFVDTGSGTIEPTQIEALPFPVTVGVDAAADAAADLAQGYRGAGSEVALIPTLPVDGAPQDMAQALSFNIDVVSVAVAIMDSTGTDFQTDRTATTEVVAAAAASGHGLVTYARGLNSSRNIAAQAGVPAGQVFRAIDPELTDPRTIGRFLDQAAFRARRDGSVIVSMPAREDMLNALVAWAFQPRSSTVTLAPLSAVLAGGGGA
ncbi:MAG: divergent polysaccharide deacetylase family protein [Pseudomonadota bacterium]